MTEEDIFHEALARDPADRGAYLDRACAGDPALRAAVDALLRADVGATGFLASPPQDVTAALPAVAEGPGAAIGPYKLLEQIGEGGFGVVFLAEQTAPVRRKVALKVLKPGMDTRQVVARFEAERQALAIMDHPNIARVFDGGATPSGRPYFVMELVKGVPITEFSDRNHLETRQRLELFVSVCHAVQHAHQKGVIHRDLKPSNVLVSRHDATPVVKVIDFGVAKALGRELTDKTLFTGVAQMIGTPLYMSPEQAGMSDLDVDTRSDIYSLGVLLYELLTGTTPVDAERFRKAAYDEVRRIIREEEPPRPSTRLSESGDSLPSISARRRTEPARLTRLVRGELDWIVMKALEKDRSRRYETANGFALDVQRYLADEPVTAGPPSAAYRFRKFARRNRAAVLTAAAILLVLLAGVAGTTFGLIRAEHRRAEADQARENEAAQRLIADAQTKKAEQAEADTLADYRASTDDAIEQLIGSKPTLGPQERAYVEKTLKRWQAFADRQGDDERSQAIRAEGHKRVAYLWSKLGRQEESRTEYEAARDLFAKLAAAFPDVPGYRRELANVHMSLGTRQRDAGRLDAARAELETARGLQQKLVAAFPDVPLYRLDLALTHNNLGAALRESGQPDASRTAYGTALDLQQKLVAAFPDVPKYQSDLARTHDNLGNLLKKMGQPDAARTEYETARDLRQKLVATFPDVPKYQDELATAHHNLGSHLEDLGQHEAARTKLETARDLKQKLVAAFPSVPNYQSSLAVTRHSLGNVLKALGQRDAARTEYEAVRDLCKPLVRAFPAVPDYQLDLALSYEGLGGLLRDLGQREAARTEYETALALLKKLAGAFPTVIQYQEVLAGTHCNLGRLLLELGHREPARAEYEAARDLFKKLAAAFTTSAKYQLQLADIHFTLGGLLVALGHREAARAEYEASINLRKTLVAAFPAVPEYRVSLAGCYNLLGSMFRDDKPADCLPWYDLAIRTLEPVYENDRRAGRAKEFLHTTHENRANVYFRLGKYAEAVKDWDRTIELNTGPRQPGIRMNRAIARQLAGQTAEAVAEAEDLTKSSNWSAGDWRNFAIIYAMASTRIADRQQQYADRAMELLRQAVKAGEKDAARLAKEPGLAALRERQDFQKLIAELEAGKN